MSSKHEYPAVAPSSQLENWQEEGTICYKKDRVEADKIPCFLVLNLLASSGV